MSGSSTNPPDAASILSALAAMAKSAPPPAPSPAPPPPSAAPFGSQTSAADPRVRNVVLSQPQATIAPTPAQAAAAAVQPPANVNPITALAALLPQAQTRYSLHEDLNLLLVNLQRRQPLIPRNSPSSKFFFNKASQPTKSLQS